jgi:uncharacterized Ntn-hydrolase superfamily protein
MTYSILARDPETGEMGVATQSQAFAVGHSVPWAMSGYGIIATQSMGEPAYGEVGLDALRSGLTAQEALTAISSIDPHPERRQVAMIDGRGGIAAYTGEKCIAQAGHRIGETCCAVANMMATERVWDAMVETLEATSGALASRLMAALRAAEKAGGDFRGSRSAAILVVCARRSGRPWRDNVFDLRVEDHADPLAELDRLIDKSASEPDGLSVLARIGAGDVAALDLLDQLRAAEAEALFRRLAGDLVAARDERLQHVRRRPPPRWRRRGPDVMRQRGASAAVCGS